METPKSVNKNEKMLKDFGKAEFDDWISIFKPNFLEAYGWMFMGEGSGNAALKLKDHEGSYVLLTRDFEAVSYKAFSIKNNANETKIYDFNYQIEYLGDKEWKATLIAEDRVYGDVEEYEV